MDCTAKIEYATLHSTMICRNENHTMNTRRLTYRALALIAALTALFTAVLVAQEVNDSPQIDEIQRLVPEIINVYPHDDNAFTQGLLLHDGVFYESTGLYGESDLREVEIETGEIVRLVDLPGEFFAEGLALVDDRFIQLTWQENAAFVYERETLELLGYFQYSGEGWGLCYDGTALFHSDGTENIDIRDPETFQTQQIIEVTIDGVPVIMLNELECVGDHIYANVWQTTRILQIDKQTGAVTALIDAQNLEDYVREELPDAIVGGTSNVLNGIAYNPESDTFYVTGKKWPLLFEVRFAAADSDN